MKNLLFLLADQFRFDALGAENPMVQTPHLDALAEAGARFTRAYTPLPGSLCLAGQGQKQQGQGNQAGGRAARRLAVCPQQRCEAAEAQGQHKHGRVGQ